MPPKVRDRFVNCLSIGCTCKKVSKKSRRRFGRMSPNRPGQRISISEKVYNLMIIRAHFPRCVRFFPSLIKDEQLGVLIVCGCNPGRSGRDCVFFSEKLNN